MDPSETKEIVLLCESDQSNFNIDYKNLTIQSITDRMYSNETFTILFSLN